MVFPLLSFMLCSEFGYMLFDCSFDVKGFFFSRTKYSHFSLHNTTQRDKRLLLQGVQIPGSEAAKEQMGCSVKLAFLLKCADLIEFIRRLKYLPFKMFLFKTVITIVKTNIK